MKDEPQLTLPKPETNQDENANGGQDSINPDPVKERQFVRINYPPDCPKQHLPELTIRYRTYQILDISETGIRFFVKNMNWLPDDILTGVIKFTDESVVDISGVVVRRTKNEIALKLIIGIPYSYILSEQVRLRNLEAEGVIKFP